MSIIACPDCNTHLYIFKKDARCYCKECDQSFDVWANEAREGEEVTISYADNESIELH